MKVKNRSLYKPPPAEDNASNYLKLTIVIIISFVFIAAQFVGGYISGSISVISDAFHLVTDLIGFTISFVFIYYSKKSSTDTMTFGYHRMELIGALGNLFIIWTLAIIMIIEATTRIIDKEFVAEPLAMLIVGGGGLIVNIIMFFVLHSGSHSHGLMTESCTHDHADIHDQDHSQQKTTSFCKEMLCQDEICLKQINYSHCHVKDPKGESSVHIHQKGRKLSQQIKEEIIQNSLNQLNDHKHNGNCSHKNQIHIHNQNCNHEKVGKSIEVKYHHQDQHDHHQHENQHDHEHGHNVDHKQGNMHYHKEGQKCSHGHADKAHDQNHEGHNHDKDHSQGHESLGMKAAVLHALSDVIQSIGLLISSLLIFFYGSNNGGAVHQWNDWHYLDPISTYIFSILVIISTVPIVRNCYSLIMEAAPSVSIMKQIRQEFANTNGVIDVHDIHIWDLRPGKSLLIAHVFAQEGKQREVLTKLTQICRHKRIYHSTLQVEQINWKNHQDYILCDHDIHT